jgi:ribosomal-protein-alanine N-acetyltransferase
MPHPPLALRPLTPADAPAIAAATRASRRLHGRWVRPPATEAEALAWLALDPERTRSYGLWLPPDGAAPQERLAGCLRLSQIALGNFRSAYLGYWAVAPHAGQGHMTRGLRLLVKEAFGPLGLGRIEANIQPGNLASVALVKRAGFRLEGFSPRYLKINGRWRDHERWALLGR